MQVCSLALLQLLMRSAADIVREYTDRDITTLLMDSMALPDRYVQALFSEIESNMLAIFLRDHDRN